MDLTVNDGTGNMLYIGSQDEFVDFCVVTKDDKQFDFNINKTEWKLLKSYIEQKLNMDDK